MKLYYLLKNINCRVVGNTILDIKGLYHKDTEVKENGLFFSLRGTRVDGNAYVLSAIKNGAVAIVTEQEIQNLSGITQIIVRDARETMSLIACKFFGNPASKLKIIGVTGTNGKTTVTSMISHVINSTGKKCSLIGTNGVVINGVKYDTGMTTPDPIELQQYFAQMVKQKQDYVCMEVSAHAIEFHKIDGFMFEAVVFTNLSEDHLDYFKSMKRYFDTKCRLFTKKYTNFAVINIDNSYGIELAKRININYVAYSISNKADYVASDITLVGAGQKFKVNKSFEINLNFAGDFNVSNALSAIATLNYLGFDDATIAFGLASMKAVDGRFNTYIVNGKLVIIDYAHTPDGLENILVTAKKIAGSNRLISVFGCGGNRDSQKRPIMGDISSRFADFTIITSDNPRFEKRETIAKEIEKGIKSKNYMIELDRTIAIKKAISMANEGDVVVLAGKGSEPYIDENGVKIPYSDMAEIEKLRR